LLSSGKSIETSLDAMPVMIAKIQISVSDYRQNTPICCTRRRRKYRRVWKKNRNTQLQHHVKFINTYLPLEELLDYLQLTDIYLFYLKDPNQAVSGTFSYAISCGCPVISTPIPR
jgi:glycosyltransferase involved in cell wall biosynthesis